MKVSTRSWHGRLYRYWANHPENRLAWMAHLDNPDRRRENLCHYVRVVLLWAPLYWLAYTRIRGRYWIRPWQPVLAAALGLLASACWAAWPDATKTTLSLLAMFMGSVGAGVVVAVVLSLAKEVFDYRREKKRGPSFARVAWEWTKARKQRICPFIDIVEEP